MSQVKGLEGSDRLASFDMSSVASVLSEAKQAPQSIKRPDTSDETPVVRGILLYGRTGVVPTWGDDEEAWSKLGCGPDMLLDVLYVHAKKTDDGTLVGNRCAVLDFFTDCDRRRISRPYIFDHSLHPKRSVCPL